ncbi:histidine--tRNA ligase [Candidatus Micrarchaeota archaeon CG1_02_55_22]|nr:MAG: histidine--tRNA ligase [Candidatus Micrarchaeota archaeon CG1_02_55_22]
MAEETNENKFKAPRGTRDFSGSEKRLRDAIIQTIREQFERYGFEPLETPAFENLAVLTAKFAGGDEILKETYSFKDQGGRDLGLRYDLTVPLCRFVAENNSLAMPFKRYAIASVWRDGPLKKGRYREFSQCDADTMGTASLAADAELASLAASILSGLGLNYSLKVNNRKLLNGLLIGAGVPREMLSDVILSLDKLEKIGENAVKKELEEKQLPAPVAQRVLSTLSPQATLEALTALAANDDAKAGLAELNEFFSYAKEYGCADKLVFSPTLARGLNYYTGMVFEGFLNNGAKIGITSSICAGGRYDELIGGFVKESGGAERNVPAVGISFGLDVLLEALKAQGTTLGERTGLAVFVIPIGDALPAIRACQQLRSAGINTGIDLAGRGVSKNLAYAVKRGAKYALIIGPNEIKEGKATLRDLNSGEEKLLSIPQVCDALR